MARKKTSTEAISNRLAIAKRVSELRTELFGARGKAAMARRLGLPLRTWYNYEEGTTIPAEVILSIIDVTSVEPTWLLDERGPKYRLTMPEEADLGRPPVLDASAATGAGNVTARKPGPGLKVAS
jgi:hypothetical protein